MLVHILEGFAMIEFRHAGGNYDVDKASVEAGLLCEDESKAVQSQRDDADINTIVRRFGLTGEIPVDKRIPLDVDIDEVMDYKSALDFIIAADKSFMSLPAQVRSSFANNPAAFVEFAGDPQNLPQLREWGLAPAAAPEPDPVSPPAPAAAPASGGG